MIDFAPLWHFINERHRIYLRKTLLEGGTPPLWANPSKAAGPKAKYTLGHLTDDPVLAQYRFCNVFRELDRVTVWIREHIREPYAGHPNLWLMLAIARTLNWPPTLDTLINATAQGPGAPSAWPADPGFEPRWMTMVLEELRKRQKIYTGAYMIRAESHPKNPWFSWSKQRYISEIVIGRLWEERDVWQWTMSSDPPPTMEDIWREFQLPQYIGWGPFMAFQVVVDMKFTRLLSAAPDRDTWAAVGPGSRRGLNRLHGRPLNYALKQDQALQEMWALQGISRENTEPHVPPISLSDLQNCLCETDKYLRVLNGEGRPRAIYVRGRGY